MKRSLACDHPCCRSEAAAQLTDITSRYVEDLAQNLRDHTREVADTRRAAERWIRRRLQHPRVEVVHLLDTSEADTPDAGEARLRSGLAALIRSWHADEINEGDAGSESP